MKLVIVLTPTLLVLCLVIQPSASATYDTSRSSELKKDAAVAIIEGLKSVILNDLKTRNEKNAEQELLQMQSSAVGDGDSDEAYIQQGRPGSLAQLQLVLRDLIRAISRLELTIRIRRG